MSYRATPEMYTNGYSVCVHPVCVLEYMCISEYYTRNYMLALIFGSCLQPIREIDPIKVPLMTNKVKPAVSARTHRY